MVKEFVDAFYNCHRPTIYSRKKVIVSYSQKPIRFQTINSNAKRVNSLTGDRPGLKRKGLMFGIPHCLWVYYTHTHRLQMNILTPEPEVSIIIDSTTK